jgi:coenzyme F420-0:L-glutamate ligase/coenzyme F420-1:gamma-L-glutamate ligase
VTQLTLTALRGIPLVQPGDDLAHLLLAALDANGAVLQQGDALVITSKIVSKAEGRIVRLNSVTPSAAAVELAERTGKDPRIVELVLQESVRVSRAAPNVLVVEHRLGFVSANAGIDQSNLEDGDERVLLLPLNPDESARLIRQRLYEATGVEVGVIISDSHGRPFRRGNINVAIGVAGMPAVIDLRGQPDLFRRTLRVSIQGYADMVASAAGLLTGEAAEGLPVVHLRGLIYPPTDGRASEINRLAEQDLYR